MPAPPPSTVLQEDPKLTFPREDWDLDFRAELYKEEFYATGAWTRQRDDLVPPWTGSTRDELTQLLALKKQERSKHIGEIIREQQGSVLIGYCYGQLEFSAIDRPRTAELLHAAIYLGGSAVMYSKAYFNRVRPWVLEPDLSPPIPLPGQPAYPGGHATQMYLMALTLSVLSPNDKDSLLSMAENVALNRERAGLNYPSDTAAGKTLAGRLFAILTSGDCPTFASTLDE